HRRVRGGADDHRRHVRAAHPVHHLPRGGETMSIATTTRRRGLSARASRWIWTVVAWVVTIVFFFPVLWMVLESLKTEVQAASIPPTILFVPTFEQYAAVLSRDFPPYFINSAIATIFS